MHNVRLIIEYNGAGFHGWQSQPGVRTIEVELLKVLRIVLREEISSVCASGRTDAGVHARAQVVNFFCHQTPDLHRLKQAVSSFFRKELSVLQADFVPDSFHSRGSALQKQYSYRIINRLAPLTIDWGHAWHVARPLSLAYLQDQAAMLVGEKDFTSFRGSGCQSRSPIKTIHLSEFSQNGSELLYRVVGSGFMKHMVRNIVGTLVELTLGKLEVRSIEELLAAKDRRQGGVTAPPQGLYLDWVSYEENSAG